MKVLSALFLIAAASAEVPPGPGMQAKGGAPGRFIGDPMAIEAGKESYGLVCSGCHGVTGEGGRGPNLVTAPGVQKASDQELFGVIKDGIPGSDMPPSPLDEERIWQLAAFVRSLSAPAISQNVPGDRDAGRMLFYGDAGCTNCHMIRGEGGYLGPDLSNLGLTLSLGRIREGLLDPNNRFAKGFDPVVVTLTDGTRIEGVAKNYSNYALQILDRAGRLHFLASDDAAAIEFLVDSWMPADYPHTLSGDEIQNMLAFLSRLSLSSDATPREGAPQ
ncbi:MAG: c-type cytochrome [Bryobacterales bacterium]|nr:c-type cytochrome [Bryobacterales bacterium]MDE0626103.1 c-type cytochrome [Bryobacterales bacterium]